MNSRLFVFFFKSNQSLKFQEQYNNVRRWLHDNSKKFKDCITNLKQLLQEAEDDPAKRLKMGIVQPLKNLVELFIQFLY
jgi:hypothetical protein